MWWITVIKCLLLTHFSYRQIDRLHLSYHSYSCDSLNLSLFSAADEFDAEVLPGNHSPNNVNVLSILGTIERFCLKLENRWYFYLCFDQLCMHLTVFSQQFLWYHQLNPFLIQTLMNVGCCISWKNRVSNSILNYDQQLSWAENDSTLFHSTHRKNSAFCIFVLFWMPIVYWQSNLYWLCFVNAVQYPDSSCCLIGFHLMTVSLKNQIFVSNQLKMYSKCVNKSILMHRLATHTENPLQW